ncbi:MAG: galactose ABC transporter substrate-binding protein [Ruminococcaceae bacterium]|nr:galactose ABC transporter substrate-binding protein [Oscillospiraceae bacterium]
MKRKILALTLCFLLSAVSLVSCKKSDSADVHVFYYTYSDTYISGVRSSLDSALSDMEISYQDHDGAGNQTTQTEQIQTAITKGAKAIVVNIVNTGSDDAANGIVSMAKNAGIPVIFFNREVSDSVITSYDKCAFVGTKAEEAGILQGQMIGEYVRDNFASVDINGDGEISYILFKGEEGNNEAIYRTQYSVEEANKILTAAGKKPLKFYDGSNPNKYLVDRNGQWSASAANEYMTTALTSYSEKHGNMIELVICNNDGMAQGAISALNSAGYNLGEGSRMIPVFGVDATDAAKDLIENKKMTGTIKQDAEGMAKAISKLVKNVLDGKDSLLHGMSEYKVDDTVSKIRIAYSKYLGEEK